MNVRDAELLSAYIDGQLSPSEARRLEGRLASDTELRDLLEDLRVPRRMLRRSPRRASPRNFTLSPLMPRLRGPEPRAVPMLRTASVLASLIFLATFAFNGLGGLASTGLAAAPMPAYGVGGGEAPTPEQPLESFAAPAPTEALGGPSDLTAPDLGEPTAVARAEAAPKEMPAPPSDAQAPHVQELPRVAASWQVLLGTAAVLFGWLAWYLQKRAARNFYSKWLEK